MNFDKEIMPGVWKINLNRFSDMRGDFVKTFSCEIFRAHGLNDPWLEEFYSVSQKNVIRGMHFQEPPEAHLKLVYCAQGMVEDVLLDLRSGPGYGGVQSIILDSQSPSALLIPKGIAHGFRSLTNNSLMVYKTTTLHSPDQDKGIRWNSFGFDWKISNPIISSRDMQHITFKNYISPFE